MNLYENRIGYFTTPSFFSQYPTNISNQARGITNQTMIVGLGRAFDGSDPITVSNAPGLDPGSYDLEAGRPGAQAKIDN